MVIVYNKRTKVVECGAKCFKVVPKSTAKGENQERGALQDMLFGEFNHSVDAKNRMFIPAKYRDELGSDFMVFRSIRDNYIKMMSMNEWENFIAPIKALPRKTSEETLRFLHRNAAKVTPDAQGRILLPQGLLEHAQIVKNAVIVGCGDYAEVWAEELYQATVEQEDQAAIREALEACGL